MNLENLFVELERKVKALELQNDRLDEGIAELLKEVNVTPKQLTTLISSPENFTESNWQTLLAEKKRLDDKLAMELKQIISPKQTKKALKEKNVPQHWLFVR